MEEAVAAAEAPLVGAVPAGVQPAAEGPKIRFAEELKVATEQPKKKRAKKAERAAEPEGKPAKKAPKRGRRLATAEDELDESYEEWKADA